MKTRNNLKQKALLLLLLLAAGAAKAQGYQSYFGADSTRLNVYTVCIDYDPTVYLVINSADTIHVNGQNYLQGIPQGVFADFFYDEEFYFREDTITGRLYRYFPLLDEEVLLCDMSLEVGDTFTFSDMWGSHQAVVNDVTFENGRKVIRFENSSSFNIYMLTFYEGIFPTALPIGYFDYYYYTECDFYLLCEYKDGEQVFDNPNFEDCYIDNPLSIQEQGQNQIKVYPTNVRLIDAITVEAKESIKNIQLFDVIGREVRCFKHQIPNNQWKINIPNCNNGLYFIKVTLEKGFYYEKVIVNH